MKQVKVKVHNDHIIRLSHVKKPLLAIEELIWNGLDADAKSVSVTFDFGPLGAIEKIRVVDDGHGIHYRDAEAAFESLGGSWKKHVQRSRNKNRILHGKAGRGRFRPFSIGNSIEWETVYADNGNHREYHIDGNKKDIGTFNIGDTHDSDCGGTGTTVTVSNIEKKFNSLLDGSALQQVTEDFALYLRQYPDISIWYNGIKINPADVEDHVTDYTLDPILLSSGTVQPKLTVIEWKSTGRRALLLCDEDGFALQAISPGIQAAGYSFTAYLKSASLRELDDDSSLVMEELDPDVRLLVEASKSKLREHFRRRTAENALNLVEDWKQQGVYPFRGEPQNVIEATERQVFDICALNISSYSPDFEKIDTKTKRMQLRLLKQAIEDSPQSVLKIMEDVLDLPKDKQEELAELLKKTTLSAVINAAKIVADRLDFLCGLELLIFTPDSKRQLLERDQLQNILVNETWIFGEEFNLTLHERSLTEVLRQHLHLLGRDDFVSSPTLRDDGSSGRVDMMLSRLVPQTRPEDREHLVVELKRPSQCIDSKIASQIESYAFAVMDDERFRDTGTKWTFFAISNDMSDNVRKKVRQAGRAEGILYEDEGGKIKVWVKTWGQLIESSRARLTFFADRLGYAADDESALAYLRKTHEQYLPTCLAEQPKEAMRVIPADDNGLS